MIGSFSLYQLLVPLLALLMITRAVSRYLRKNLSGRELFAWIVVWCLISGVAFFPDVTIDWLSKITGIKSGINALIFFALVVLTYGYLRLLMKMEDQERKLTELVRTIALSKLKNP